MKLSLVGELPVDDVDVANVEGSFAEFCVIVCGDDAEHLAVRDVRFGERLRVVGRVRHNLSREFINGMFCEVSDENVERLVSFDIHYARAGTA